MSGTAEEIVSFGKKREQDGHIVTSNENKPKKKLKNERMWTRETSKVGKEARQLTNPFRRDS